MRPKYLVYNLGVDYAIYTGLDIQQTESLLEYWNLGCCKIHFTETL